MFFFILKKNIFLISLGCLLDLFIISKTVQFSNRYLWLCSILLMTVTVLERLRHGQSRSTIKTWTHSRTTVKQLFNAKLKAIKHIGHNTVIYKIVIYKIFKTICKIVYAVYQIFSPWNNTLCRINQDVVPKFEPWEVAEFGDLGKMTRGVRRPG